MRDTLSRRGEWRSRHGEVWRWMVGGNWVGVREMEEEMRMIFFRRFCERNMVLGMLSVELDVFVTK